MQGTGTGRLTEAAQRGAPARAATRWRAGPPSGCRVRAPRCGMQPRPQLCPARSRARRPPARPCCALSRLLHPAHNCPAPCRSSRQAAPQRSPAQRPPQSPALHRRLQARSCRVRLPPHWRAAPRFHLTHRALRRGPAAPQAPLQLPARARRAPHQRRPQRREVGGQQRRQAQRRRRHANSRRDALLRRAQRAPRTPLHQMQPMQGALQRRRRPRSPRAPAPRLALSLRPAAPPRRAALPPGAAAQPHRLDLLCRAALACASALPRSGRLHHCAGPPCRAAQQRQRAVLRLPAAPRRAERPRRQGPRPSRAALQRGEHLPCGARPLPPRAPHSRPRSPKQTRAHRWPDLQLPSRPRRASPPQAHSALQALPPQPTPACLARGLPCRCCC